MKPTYEYAGNLHMHTRYSDGSGSHAEIAQAALRAGLDFVIVTDHNVHVSGIEGYYYGDSPGQKVLLLVGEEIHDPRRDPQVNHMLVYGADAELSPYAPNPEALLGEINARSASSYLAHPIERAALLFGEAALPWVTWNIEGYTGIELWNYMSEFKSYLSGKSTAVRAALNPDDFISGPFPETLALWDKLLREGKRVKVIGGADAHANTYSIGPVSRVIFPYEVLFQCVNTHILTPIPLVGELEPDKKLVLAALREGKAFVGYDLPASTRGFQFIAQGLHTNAVMGEWLRLGHGVTLQIVCPQIALVRLIRDGEVVLEEREGTHRTYIANRPGAYRVEARLPYKGKQRGWIFSNPIFIVP